MLNASSKYSPCGGFSLLEILLVLFVISLAAVFVLPSFSLQGSIKQDARLVASILRYVNDTALATKEPCSLKANLQTKTLAYQCLAEHKEYSIASLQKIETSSLSASDNEEVYILLSPGQQDTLKVYLLEDNRAMRVHLNSLSGRVKVVEEEK